MTSFDVNPPEERPSVGLPTPAPADRYDLHPLAALDGVLIYVTLGGEHVGTFFGKTERAAAAAVAAELAAAASGSARPRN